MFAPEPAITPEQRVVTSTAAVASALSSAASATSPGQKDAQQDVALLCPDIHQLLPPAAAAAAPAMDLWGVADGHGHLGSRVATIVKDVREFTERKNPVLLTSRIRSRCSVSPAPSPPTSRPRPPPPRSASPEGPTRPGRGRWSWP